MAILSRTMAITSSLVSAVSLLWLTPLMLNRITGVLFFLLRCVLLQCNAQSVHNPIRFISISALALSNVCAFPFGIIMTGQDAPYLRLASFTGDLPSSLVIAFFCFPQLSKVKYLLDHPAIRLMFFSNSNAGNGFSGDFRHSVDTNHGHQVI